MSERINCPSCGAGLILPDLVRGSLATCPRCLAEISTITTSAAGREADAIQTERPERREERVRLRERGSDDAPDIDVRRDMQGTSCLVIVLAVIGGLGVGLAGLMALTAFAQSFPNGERHWELLFQILAQILAIPIFFLAGLSTLIVFVRSRGNLRGITFRRVAVGTLALAGVVSLFFLSVFVYAFIVCYGTHIP